MSTVTRRGQSGVVPRAASVSHVRSRKAQSALRPRSVAGLACGGSTELVTAAHCLDDTSCPATSIVFGYNNAEANHNPQSFDLDDVYRCIDARGADGIDAVVAFDNGGRFAVGVSWAACTARA